MHLLNEYGELEIVKPGNWGEALELAEVGVSVAGVVLIESFLAILFMFTGENGLVCCF